MTAPTLTDEETALLAELEHCAVSPLHCTHRESEAMARLHAKGLVELREDPSLPPGVIRWWPVKGKT